MIIPVDLCRNAPGTLGKVVRYVESGAIHEQPQLALCAALSALSVIKAHRVRSETNLRTNILCIALASSGEGKGHGLKAVSRLFSAIDRRYLLSGIPASNVGMVNSLSETGKKLILWDEFGLDLKEMTSLRAPAYKSAIIKDLMAKFSEADVPALGLEYKNTDGKQKRIDIDEPCLSLYAASTPIRFYESLNSAFVMDGFIPRLFIFNGLSGSKSEYDSYIKKPTLNTRDISAVINDSYPVGNLAKFNKKKKPEIVRFDNGLAMVKLFSVIDNYNKLKILSPLETHRAIYARATEHFVKLCLIAEDSLLVKSDTAVWAEAVTDVLIRSAIEVASKKVFDSEEEKKKGRLTEIVFNAKLISRRDLIRATAFLKNYEREQMLKELLESEVLETESRMLVTDSTVRRKNTTFYKPRA